MNGSDSLAESPSLESEDGAVQMNECEFSTQAPPLCKIAKKFVKHDVYWLSDGNILVQIGEVRFRLHQSALVKQSKWFRKLIENPPHDTCIRADEETGATVYCLDSLEIGVKDFAALLNALDDAVSYVFNGLPSLNIVSAILRAAHALEFHQFKAFAISCLEHKYPNRLDKLTTNRVEYAANTVQLARQCNVKSVLKRALYELVRAEGFRQETVLNTDDNHDEEADSNQSALTIFDHSLLVHAREQLTTFWFGKVFPPPAIIGCQNPRYNPCAANWGKSPSIYKRLIIDSKIFEKYRYDPICGLDVIINAPWCRGETWPPTCGVDLPIIENDHLCRACAQKWRSSWREEKSMLWSKLDAWFQLSD